jgi:ABC-type antimicrobial peptide transport system permease subunit
MLKNYFGPGWRAIKNNKAFSLINILGLALGLTCSLLIFLWVQDERSMDHFHANGDRLYTVFERVYTDGKINAGYNTPGPLAPELKKIIPEIEYASGSAMPAKLTFEAAGKIIKVEGGFADSDYFNMFSYPLLQGSPLTALNAPVSLAISEKMAKQFFGSAAAAFGKTIRCDNKKDLSVTAVFADCPRNTSQKFDYLINWPTLQEYNASVKNWNVNGPNTQLLLKPGADPMAVRAKIKKFLDAYNKEQTASYRIELDMQLFGDGYLHSNFKNGQIAGGRIEYISIFSLVAVFILLIACINFMNLTTALSAKRAKEIGVRKVAGALRSSLVRQFLGEALFITSLSVLLSLIGVTLLLPLFNQWTGKQIELPVNNSYFWFGLVALTLVTGLIAGSYPALLLSSFKPIRVLKGTLQSSQTAGRLRKGLVVFQFVLSIVLIVGTLIISKQVNYVQQINLGYDRQNLLYIPLEGELVNKFELFSDLALRTPGIQSLSRISVQSPSDIENQIGGVFWEGKDPNATPMFTQAATGYDFVKTMGLELLQGRDFSRDFGSDSAGYIINEAALKIINYISPIGKPLTQWGKKGTIIGVLKDFHYTSLHDPIKPLIIRMGAASNYGSVLVRTEPGKTPQALAGLEKIAQTLNPKFSFTWSFSDEEYQRLYKSEQVVNRLSNAFAALAIFISCIGLLGLAMFTAERRAKEMSIRKVLGASAGVLFMLLSREFIFLVLLALGIAIPIAWLSMNDWLLNFAYRIDIKWWFFGLAGAMAVLIALATVSVQAIKAAMVSPMKSLRSE